MDECGSRRERKKQQTRQRLLEAGWRLFREQGYDDTTVAEIAEAADVAKATLFNYFPTKESLLDQIGLWRIHLLGDRLLEVQDAPESVLGRIKLMTKAMVKEFTTDPSLARHMYLARVGAPVHREHAHRLGSLMHELVVQGQADSEIRDDVDAHLIARLLMTCWFHHLSHWWHENGDHLEETQLMHAVDALMEGLEGRST
jgi:AcrR family transcriptional regulator